MRQWVLAMLAVLWVGSTSQADDGGEPTAAHKIEAILAAYDQDNYDDLQSVVVVRNGQWLAERYFNGANSNTLVDIRSAGKSITSLLMGIALDIGAVDNLDDPVQKYWPDAAGTALGPIPIRHVLTMRTGLNANADNPSSPGYEDNMDTSNNPLAVALAVPVLDAPGTAYRYNSLAAYMTGIVVGRSTGAGLETLAREKLFGPLDITHYDWQEDRSGITKGQGNLSLTARGFARIGEMVLNRGTYGGRRIVSERWINESLTPHVDISTSTSNAAGYGYYWYQTSYDVGGRSVEVFFASGNGGNKIYIIPKRDMMVSVMSTAYGQGRGHRRSEAILKDILNLY